ncbi:MAG: DNA alkylation repair protein [Desulfobacteraceae bacterium]|nr:MAG: DNA alkylation repair protein [Desulfobacteraceae bacterium]
MTSEEIQHTLRRMANPGIAAHSQQFFKTGKGQYGEGDVFLGLRVPDLRKTARSYNGVPLSVCADILASPYHEERLFALILLVNRFQKADPKDQAAIYQLYRDQVRYVNNWDLVDISAPAIVGGYFMDKDPRPLLALAESPDLWERRISIVATWTFIRRNELELTFRISDILLYDKEDLIHKAVGWMLRETGKKDQAALEGFLKPRYPKMPRTMLRYAIEKFEATNRKAYLLGHI